LRFFAIFCERPNIYNSCIGLHKTDLSETDHSAKELGDVRVMQCINICLKKWWCWKIKLKRWI